MVDGIQLDLKIFENMFPQILLLLCRSFRCFLVRIKNIKNKNKLERVTHEIKLENHFKI
jgi:hypothetical protein